MQAGDVRTTVSYLLARATARLPGIDWRRYRLVATPSAGMPAALPRGWRVAEASDCPSDLCPAATARFRSGQGMACLTVAPPSGPPVATLWLGAGPFDEDEAQLRFVPPPGWAWDTGLYVSPSARGGRAFAALWAAARMWLETRGLSGSMSRIADYAEPVLAAHDRMGASTIGTAAVLRTGSRVWTWGARPMTATLDEPRPVVQLEAP